MRVVLTGASGQLGAYALGRLVAAGHVVKAWAGRGGGSVDLTDPSAVAKALDEDDPDAVVHTAAMSAADDVRRDPRAGWEVNVSATARLAEWCDGRGRTLVYTSTDLVFDGSRAMSSEADRPSPVLEYGRTKRAGELAVLGSSRGIVARVSLLYGPARGGRVSYFDKTVAAVRRGEPQSFFEDEYRTPLDLWTAGDALARLVGIDFTGLVHVGGTERMSRYDLARRFTHSVGLDSRLILPSRRSEAVFPEPRPVDVSLDTARLETLLPGLNRTSVEDATARMVGTG